jgi:microcystin-dependent protein
MFAGNFAPAGWMFCEGQLLPISENETLFNLIGTTYGGDGQSTFALPDLRGRVPIHQGTGGGMTYLLAETGGVEDVTLTTNQIPNHTHPMAVQQSGTRATPKGTIPASSPLRQFTSSAGSLTTMNPNMVGTVGGSQPHTNFMPYLCVDFIISLFGIFPSPT